MIVLTTSTDPQTITFVPREVILSGKLILTEKRTRDSIEVIATFQENGNYTESTNSFNLIEGVKYSLEVVSDSNDIVYRDMIKCTDQTEYDKYNTQEGDYIEAEVSDNKIVVINN